MPTFIESAAEEESPLEEIRSLLHSNNLRKLQAELKKWLPMEVAQFFEELTPPERVLLFRALPRGQAAAVFSHLTYELQDTFLHELTERETSYLLEDLSPDDRTALLEELPANVTQKLLRLLKPEDLAIARKLLGYPEDSVGRIMTPDYIDIKPDMTVEEALKDIREKGQDTETVNIIYVTDEEGKLQDELRLRRLILADPQAKVSSLMNYKVFSLSAHDDQETAVQMIQHYDMFALPVTDSEEVLIGIVTADDLFDVAEEEVTEDFHKGAAVTPLDMPYSQASASFLVKKRIGWLTILIFVNLISAWIISIYEEYLIAFIQLAFFMPLLIASGGNAGAQSATLMVRAISTGDIRPSQWFRAFRKEMGVGLALGTGVGLVTYLLGFHRGGPEISMVVGLSMVSIIFIANLLGVVLPFILTRFKLDPATASSPLITSIMDAIGVFIYFGIAAALLTFAG